MNKIIQIGNLRKETIGFDNPQTGRIYSIYGIAPTINTCQGGGHEPKVMVVNMKNVCKRKIVGEGLRTIEDTGNSTTNNGKREIENGDVSYRIRKLTPRECWRLMGFSDDAFDKAEKAGVSNSQLYKQAGNSIVTDVLYYIFKELYEAMPYLFDNLKIGSYFSGIGAFEIGMDRLFNDIATSDVDNKKNT